MVEGACLENRCTATYRGFESLTHRIKASIRWLFAFRSGFHPLIPRRSAAAPRGMPAALRFAGCLPVVASLLPPGTRLMALRPFGPQNCLAVTKGGAKERSDCANPSLTLHFGPSGLRTASRQAGGGDRRGGLRRGPNGAWGEEGLRPRPAPPARIYNNLQEILPKNKVFLPLSPINSVVSEKSVDGVERKERGPQRNSLLKCGTLY